MLMRTTCPAFAAATTPSLYAIVLKPPITMAKVLGSSSHHLDRTIVIAET